MRTTVEREDPEVGYTWGQSGDTYYLRSPDDEFRGVSENVLKLLDDLATGEVHREDLPENARRIVERLDRLGYLRDGEPVVRVHTPEDVRFWPRFSLFLVMTAVALFVAARNVEVLWEIDGLLTPLRVALVVGLGLLTIVIHEAGHVLASRPFFDASPRLGTVNGVLPAFISDTNGAWMLPRNRKRWVSLAGPFAQVCWVLVLDALYLAAFPDSAVLRIAVVFFALSLLANLNPLIHGDGYWLLVDTFGIVNLRSRGIADVQSRTPSLAAGYVLLSYSFAAVLFVVSVLYLLSMGPTGLALLSALLVLIAVNAREELRALAARLTA